MDDTSRALMDDSLNISMISDCWKMTCVGRHLRAAAGGWAILDAGKERFNDFKRIRSQCRFGPARNWRPIPAGTAWGRKGTGSYPGGWTRVL